MTEQFWDRWFDGKQFTTDWTSRAFPAWSAFLSYLKQFDNIRVLEIGAWEGRSTLFFLNYFPNCRIVSMDLFTLGNEALFDGNVMAGHGDRVTKIKSRSSVALDKLATRKDVPTFNLIYIDGSHDRDDVIVDSIMAWRLLDVGGLMVWDDYGLTEAMVGQFNIDQDPKPAIDLFMQWHKGEMTLIHMGYQVIVRKTKPHHPPCLDDPAA